MTARGIADRLVATHGREVAEDKATLRVLYWRLTMPCSTMPQAKRTLVHFTFWLAVASAIARTADAPR